MKKISTFVMLALLVIGLVPGALAQETQTRVGVEASIYADDTSTEGSVDAEATTDTDTETDTRRTREERRTAIRTDVRTAVRSNVTVPRRVFADIRAQMSAKLDLAIERCKQAPDPSHCETAIKNRQETLARFQTQDIERAQKLEARLVANHRALVHLRANKDFAKFKGPELQARVVATEHIAAAEERYSEAKENYQEAREQYAESKAEFRVEAKKAKECTDDSAECTQARAKAKEHAIAQLEYALEAATSQLEKIKSRVEASTDLSAQEAADLTAKIDAKLALAAELSVNVDALSAESTKEEISLLAKDVRNLLKDLDVALKLHAGRAINARIGNVILHTKQLSTRLEHSLVKLAEQGKDTSSVEPLIVEFNAQLDIATAAYTSAQAKFSAGDVKGAHEQVRAAHAALTTAHNKLKEIVRAIHSMDGREELEESLADGAVDAEIEAAAEVSGETA